MSDSEHNFDVLAALVAGAHGVGGNVRLRLIGDDPEASVRSLPAGRLVRLVRDSDGFARDLTLTSLRRQSQPKGAWIARFKDVSDRTEAEELFGCGVFIKESERAPLPEGEHYVDELLGLEVVTEAGAALGKLTDVLHSPAHDVYVTDQDVLIPAVAAFVVNVDLAARRIEVRDIPGLRGEA